MTRRGVAFLFAVCHSAGAIQPLFFALERNGLDAIARPGETGDSKGLYGTGQACCVRLGPLGSRKR
jgi:hypothetical protein